MAPISTKAHGILDYATGAAMLAAPSALRIRDVRAAVALWGAGAGTIGASAISDHELALRRALPMPAHLLLDVAAGLTLAAVPFAALRGRGGIRSWVPHAVFGVGELAVAALTERRARPQSSARPEPQAEHYDEALVAREERAAAAAAGRIGGVVRDDADDPALAPVYEAGGGEQEGWEGAENELIEHATHGDGGGDPLRDAITPEVESDLSGAVHGEADHTLSTEVVEDPGAGEDDPGAGPGLAAERGPGLDPRQEP